MFKVFKQHITINFPFLLNSKFIVAISGGIDSVVLAYLCYKMNMNFVLAHCNFNLRGRESDADANFVYQLSRQWDLDVYIENFNAKQYAADNNLSLQVAARKLRYIWFDELAAKNKLEYILTAHHANDNFETFIINLSRGTGLDGLIGIPKINGNIVRPLLIFEREIIDVFAKEKGLKWREDSSNSSIQYLRNNIRYNIIPVLTSLNEQLIQNFEKTQQNLKQARTIINDRVIEVRKKVSHKIENGGVAFNINELQKLNDIPAYLYELFNAYGFTQWHDLLNLLTAQSGKKIFSKSHRLLKDRDFLILSKIKERDYQSIQIQNSQSMVLTPFGTLKINKCNQKVKALKHIAYFDNSLLKFPLTLRKWEHGDWFYPLGMKDKKKVSKFFKDEKLSLLDKENTWLLCSNGSIIWILNHRIDNRFRATKDTTEILKIEITK